VFKLFCAKYVSPAIGVIFLTSLLTACSKPDDAIEQKNIYHQTANIQTIAPSEHYEVVREYIGKVTSKQFTSLSFEYGGKVENVYIDSGEQIKKGQLLATFNTELLEIKLQEIAASISQLNAQAELNRLNLERINKLSEKGYSSQQKLDELQTEKKVISADLARQQANKSTINYQISKAKLHAPFDAVISTRSVAEGEVFSPNQIAFEIIKQAEHEIAVGVPVKVARELTIGKTLDVELGQQKVSAKILVVGKQVNQISRTVELRLAVPTQSSFYNGQLAKIKIHRQINEPGFWLPLSALTDGIRGQWNIFQVNDIQNNLYAITATTIEVKYSTLDAAYIVGLPLKQHQIIVAGVHRYVPGQIVKKAQKNDSQTANAGNTL
jgi:RND family efflux transporter MFP subunit